jgi:hypothetical protein
MQWLIKLDSRLLHRRLILDLNLILIRLRRRRLQRLINQPILNVANL